MGEQQDDNMRWVRRGSVLAVLLIGWIFILVTNHFRITPPVVFVCLGYLAGVCAIYTLYRTGATAVTETNEADDAMSWDKPMGALDELHREKRALLKAIKESEFDLQMGKLSQNDADAMIAIYRGRAIEVIKEIEVQETAGETGTVRDRILREARARIELEDKSKADQLPAISNLGKKAVDKQKARAEKLAEAVSAAKAAQPAEAVEEPPVEAKVEDPPEAKPDVKAEAKAEEISVPVETKSEEASGSKEAAR
jgi:hypothetical protein